MGQALHEQAKRFHHAFADLMRCYQFRDRNQIACHGLSVSQCYTLEALDREGGLAMGELACQLHLDVSTMTRVIDVLVAQGLAARVEDKHDRRVCRVQITRRGRSRVASVRSDLISEYERVLGDVPTESREAVIRTITRLLHAFRQRQSGPLDLDSAVETSRPPRRGRAGAA